MNTANLVVHCGEDIGTDWEDVFDQLKSTLKTRQDATDEEIEMTKQKARYIYLCTAYVISSNKHRYGKHIEDTRKSDLKVYDEYLKSMMDAFNLVSRWINEPSGHNACGSTSIYGLTFAHTAAPRPYHLTVTCLIAGKLAYSVMSIQIANASASST